MLSVHLWFDFFFLALKGLQEKLARSVCEYILVWRFGFILDSFMVTGNCYPRASTEWPDVFGAYRIASLSSEVRASIKDFLRGQNTTGGNLMIMQIIRLSKPIINMIRSTG